MYHSSLSCEAFARSASAKDGTGRLLFSSEPASPRLLRARSTSAAEELVNHMGCMWDL